VILDWPSLEAASIDKLAPVDQVIYNVRLNEALDVICSQVGGATRLAWRWEGDWIVISTADEIERHSAKTIGVVDCRHFESIFGPPTKKEAIDLLGVYGRPTFRHFFIAEIDSAATDGERNWGLQDGGFEKIAEIDDRLIFASTAESRRRVDRFLWQIENPIHP